MADWRSFWDSEHSIYVNARHKDVHYREIAEQIAAFVPGPNARVLDFGCGDAIHADKVAAVAAQVLLCDAAPSVRAAMAQRFAGNPKIKVIAPEEVDALPSASFDLIVANSVAQYLSREELDRAARGMAAIAGAGRRTDHRRCHSAGRRRCERCRGAATLCADERLSDRGARWPRPHCRVALSQAARQARHLPIHASRIHGEAPGRRLHAPSGSRATWSTIPRA